MRGAPGHLPRAWFGATALGALAGLVLQVSVTAEHGDGRFGPAGRVANLLCFFTIQSVLLVAGTCALLALRPDRPSMAFRVLRLAGLADIVIAAVAHRLAFIPHQSLAGRAAAADVLLHDVIPVAAVLGWLVFGPRAALGERTVAWAALGPLGWALVTVARGPLAGGYYPYPFIDVGVHGYVHVLGAIVLIAAAYGAVAGAVLVVEATLTRRSAAGAAAGTTGATGAMAGPRT